MQDTTTKQISIAGQSRKDLIKEVIVSENSGDTQSRAVANAFSDNCPYGTYNILVE